MKFIFSSTSTVLKKPIKNVKLVTLLIFIRYSSKDVGKLAFATKMIAFSDLLEKVKRNKKVGEETTVIPKEPSERTEDREEDKEVSFINLTEIGK